MNPIACEDEYFARQEGRRRQGGFGSARSITPASPCSTFHYHGRIFGRRTKYTRAGERATFLQDPSREALDSV